MLLLQNWVFRQLFFWGKLFAKKMVGSLQAGNGSSVLVKQIDAASSASWTCLVNSLQPKIAKAGIKITMQTCSKTLSSVYLCPPKNKKWNIYKTPIFEFHVCFRGCLLRWNARFNCEVNSIHVINITAYLLTHWKQYLPPTILAKPQAERALVHYNDYLSTIFHQNIWNWGGVVAQRLRNYSICKRKHCSDSYNYFNSLPPQAKLAWSSLFSIRNLPKVLDGACSPNQCWPKSRQFFQNHKGKKDFTVHETNSKKL